MEAFLFLMQVGLVIMPTYIRGVSLSIQHAFSSTAEVYDRNRSRLIPGFESLYRWAVDLVPDDATQILDLGAGTGLLSAFVRARFPDASLHLIDLSAAMLAKAEERFAGDQRITFEVADYSVAALQGGYHAVVSALSIHHLEDKAKRTLFETIMKVLLPGGVFVNAEQVLGSTPALEERYKREWLHQVRALGATEQEISDSLFRQQADRCASVEDQVDWMRSAGFNDVDCWFKEGRFATLAGIKPR